MLMRIDCCFEDEHKGIYIEVENTDSHVEVSFYKNFKYEESVCLREEDAYFLIVQLNEFLNRKTV
jgi:hypothetical protein